MQKFDFVNQKMTAIILIVMNSFNKAKAIRDYQFFCIAYRFCDIQHKALKMACNSAVNIEALVFSFTTTRLTSNL